MSPYKQPAGSYKECRAFQQSLYYLLLSLTLHTFTRHRTNGAMDGFVKLTLATLHQSGAESVGIKSRSPFQARADAGRQAGVCLAVSCLLIAALADGAGLTLLDS